MIIKNLRNKFNITIREAAAACSIPVRTYIRYENNDQYGDLLKRNAILETLSKKYEITEKNGLLTVDKIKALCEKVFLEYGNEISFCYLFGSYAKGYAKDNSDVDLLISTSITGLEYLELIEKLAATLCKKVDLLRLIDQKDNIELLTEIMKDGIKIYG